MGIRTNRRPVRFAENPRANGDKQAVGQERVKGQLAVNEHNPVARGAIEDPIGAISVFGSGLQFVTASLGALSWSMKDRR